MHLLTHTHTPITPAFTHTHTHRCTHTQTCTNTCTHILNYRHMPSICSESALSEAANAHPHAPMCTLREHTCRNIMYMHDRHTHTHTHTHTHPHAPMWTEKTESCEVVGVGKVLIFSSSLFLSVPLPPSPRTHCFFLGGSVQPSRHKRV